MIGSALQNCKSPCPASTFYIFKRQGRSRWLSPVKGQIASVVSGWFVGRCRAAGTAARAKEGLQKADAESRPGPLSFLNKADLGQGISSGRHFLLTVSRRCYLAPAR